MTRTDVFSGFLGAGKTTLIQKLIQDVYRHEKTVIIENEFGEIGIDGGFLEASGIEVREINSGCICCSLQGDFEESLKKVLDTYHPDRIVIEPSGVGKLSDVIKAIEKVDGLEINSACTVVDAARAKVYSRNFGEFFNDQIASAGCVILSRTQLVSDEKLHQAVEIVKAINPKARIVTTPWDELTGKAILKVMEGAVSLMDEHEHHHHDEHCDCGCHEHHHHADEVFTSVGFETIRKFTKEELESILSKLDEQILRAKGIVKNAEGGWLFFDYVPGDTDVREGSASYTGLITVIGSKVDELELKKLFGVE